MGELLDGKKSYLVSIGVVLAAAGSFLTGEATLGQAITAALGGLGVASVRAGIAKNGMGK